MSNEENLEEPGTISDPELGVPGEAELPPEDDSQDVETVDEDADGLVDDNPEDDDDATA